MVVEVNIFKKFSDVYTEVYKKYKAGPSVIDIAKAQDKLNSKELLNPFYREKLEQQLNDFQFYKLNALREIEIYILDFKKWLPKASNKTIDRVRYFINHNCSYRDTHEKFGGKLSAIQVCIFRACSSFATKLDHETLDLIANAETKEEVDSAMLTFKTKAEHVKTSNYLIEEVVNIIPDAQRKADIHSWDCLQELKFLKVYSKNYMEEYHKKLVEDNMTHLLYILESNDIHYKAEKDVFYKFLTGEITLDELKAKLQEIKDSKPFKRHEKSELEN